MISLTCHWLNIIHSHMLLEVLATFLKLFLVHWQPSSPCPFHNNCALAFTLLCSFPMCTHSLSCSLVVFCIWFHSSLLLACGTHNNSSFLILCLQCFVHYFTTFFENLWFLHLQCFVSCFMTLFAKFQHLCSLYLIFDTCTCNVSFIVSWHFWQIFSILFYLFKHLFFRI